MTTNKEHPHAEVLRAIADGVPIDEFEARHKESGAFLLLRQCFATDELDENPADGWITQPDTWQIRRKPQHIMVNGFKVPRPLDVMPSEQDTYFAPAFDGVDLLVECKWTDHSIDHAFYSNKVAHATKEAAIAHAKAMLGIDPEYFK